MVAIDFTLQGVSIPTGTSGQITIYEDVGNGGGANTETRAGTTVSYDNKDTVALSGGTTSYTTADVFDGANDNGFQIVPQVDNTDITLTATQAFSVTLENISLPAPTVTAASVGTNSVELSITDNATFEDAITVDRRRQYSDGSFGVWSEIASLAPDTTTYTDNNVVPGTTYEYRVTNVTSYTEASTTVQATTTADAVQDTTPVQSGWYVEITASDGTTRTFTSEGDPTRDPSLKDLEEVRLPRRKDRSFDAPKWADADVRVWQDGKRLPVDTLKTREQPTGQTALRCVGPAELYAPDTYEFVNTDVHAAADAVLSDTSLPYTVVAPQESSRTFADVDTQSEFQAYYQDPGAETPIYIDSNGLHLAQTCQFAEGEDVGGDVRSGSSYSAGLAGALQLDSMTFTFTLDHEIPAGQVGVYVREAFDNYSGEVQMELDGNVISARDLTGTTVTQGVGWLFQNGRGTGTEYTAELSAGEHELFIRTTNYSSGEYLVDCVTVFDERYHDGSTFDDSVDANGYLSSPELYPSGGTNAVLLHNGFLSAAAGQFDGTFDDTSGAQAVAISNDYGSTYTVANNSDTVSNRFTTPGPDMQLRITLDAYGSRTTGTPTQNYAGQTLQDYVLTEDVRNSPALTNGKFEGDRKDILTNLCNRGNVLWAAEWVNGEIQVRVSNVEDLTSSRDLDLVDYQWETQTLGRQIERATIKGGAQPVRDEPITADLGVAVQLNNTNLVTGSEVVRDANDDTVYVNGTDYEIDTYTSGDFRALPTGNISDGQALTIDYEWKPEGDFATSTWDAKNHVKKKFVGATTDEICRAVAYYLVDTLKEPVVSGQATTDDVPPGFSLLDVFAADPLPSDVTDSFVIENATVNEGQVQAALASRRPESEIISGIDRALGSVKDRV